METVEPIRDRAKKKLKLLHNLKPPSSQLSEANIGLSTPSPSVGDSTSKKKQKFSSPLPAKVAKSDFAVRRELKNSESSIPTSRKHAVSGALRRRSPADVSTTGTSDIQRMKVPIGLVEIEGASLVGQKTSMLIDRAPFKPTPATEELGSLLRPASTRLIKALLVPAGFRLEIVCTQAGMVQLLDEPDIVVRTWEFAKDEMLNVPAVLLSSLNQTEYTNQSAIFKQTTQAASPDYARPAAAPKMHVPQGNDSGSGRVQSSVNQDSKSAYEQQACEFRLACSSKEHMKAEILHWLHLDGGLLELF